MRRTLRISRTAPSRQPMMSAARSRSTMICPKFPSSVTFFWTTFTRLRATCGWAIKPIRPMTSPSMWCSTTASRPNSSFPAVCRLPARSRPPSSARSTRVSAMSSPAGVSADSAADSAAAPVADSAARAAQVAARLEISSQATRHRPRRRRRPAITPTTTAAARIQAGTMAEARSSSWSIPAIRTATRCSTPIRTIRARSIRRTTADRIRTSIRP